VGREGAADIQLPCESVSRNHASIIFENDEFVLKDNGSSNGSHVNGIQTVGHQVLKHLDIVRFGSYVFLVNLQDGIDEKTGLPARQEVEFEPVGRLSAGEEASAPNSRTGLSLKLTEPVGIRKWDTERIKMTLGSL
jgi:pSer/pThr/pTyr-binding forkhead associated (FHA) protein